MGLTYKDAGVDINAGDDTVDRIKPIVKSTHNEKVLANIGLFGGFFDAKFDEYEHPILVSSVDGVGTKLKIAFATGVHNTVGQCLVNHCVNDILCCGAKPLFFLDYFASGKLDPGIAEKVVEGFAIACKQNGVALIGGETAEMPSMYADGEYDMSGTIVGVVDKSAIIDGKKIKAGDALIGLRSNGLHTNGYSLARAALLSKYKTDEKIDELGETVGEALLRIHKSYLRNVTPLLERGLVSGISHITGGGIEGNTKRILPEGLSLEVDWNSWEIPPIFKLIQNAGEIEIAEMRRAFNLGIGMILVASNENVSDIISHCKELEPLVIGRVV